MANNNGSIYAYNCIFTGKDANIEQIYGNYNITTQAENLIEGINDITREIVFGDNLLNPVGYIRPLGFAKSATRLSTSDIETPNIPTATPTEIIQKLISDQINITRPVADYVTFGAVETGAIVLTVDTTAGGTADPLGATRWDSMVVVSIEATPDRCYSFKY